jgi:hypothetical protein
MKTGSELIESNLTPTEELFEVTITKTRGQR